MTVYKLKCIFEINLQDKKKWYEKSNKHQLIRIIVQERAIFKYLNKPKDKFTSTAFIEMPPPSKIVYKKKC